MLLNIMYIYKYYRPTGEGSGRGGWERGAGQGSRRNCKILLTGKNTFLYLILIKKINSKKGFQGKPGNEKIFRFFWGGGCHQIFLGGGAMKCL